MAFHIDGGGAGIEHPTTFDAFARSIDRRYVPTDDNIGLRRLRECWAAAVAAEREACKAKVLALERFLENTMATAADKQAFEQRMASEPCRACWHKEHRSVAITDDACRCAQCGVGPMSGDYMHSCKTGWRKPICDACNAAL
jgi:hypothetical protein